MKNFIPIFMFLFLNSFLHGQITDGLVVHLPGDGNALDQSGNASHGVLNGGVSYVNDRFGNSNSAFTFNGQTAYIDITSAISFGGQDIGGTLSTWIKANEPMSPEQHIFAYTRSSYYTYLVLRIRDGKVTIYSKVNGGSGDFHYSTNDIVIEKGKWHHVAVTQNGTTGLNIYVDGNLTSGSYIWTKDKTVWFKTISDNSGNSFLLGSSIINNYQANYFDGDLDDVRIYNRELDSNDIAELFNFGNPCLENITVSSSEIIHINTCDGVDSGSYEIIEINENGVNNSGSYEYTFYDSNNNLVQGASTVSKVLDLEIGDYYVTIKNMSSLCESENIVFSILDQTVHPDLSISSSQDNTSLDLPNGELSVVVDNPVDEGLYSYSWFSGSDLNDESVPIGSAVVETSAVSNAILGLEGGDYWVKVLNGLTGGCIAKIGATLNNDLLSSEWITNGSDVNYIAGNVGIGTTTADAKLTVKGDIHAERIQVDLNIPAPDYVFEADYNLRTLEETAAYIQENKHLPEVPSAKELESEGIDLVEMNMLLLKKIEELTIHMIQLKSENKVLKERMDQL